MAASVRWTDVHRQGTPAGLHSRLVGVRTTDWGELAFIVIICVMMVIGGLSEGYPGLALIGGFFLALFAITLIISLLTDVIQKRAPRLGRLLLIPGALPVGALAVAMFSFGDGEMKLLAVFLAGSYAAMLAFEFLLPDDPVTLTARLPGIRLEGEQAERMAEAFGMDPPDAAGPGEPRVTTVTREYTFKPGDEARVIDLLSRLPGVDADSAESLVREALGGEVVEGRQREKILPSEFVIIQQGDLNPMEETLARLVLGGHGVKLQKTAPGTGSASLARTRRLLSAGNPQAALNELASAVGKDSSREARLLKGIALTQCGALEEALEELKDIAAEPGAAEAWFWKGEALRQLERPTEAKEAYEQACAFAIADPDGGLTADRAALPMSLLRLGRSEAARTSLDNLLTMRSDDPSLLCVQALLDVESGDVELVAERLQQALVAEPGYVVRVMKEPSFAQLAESEPLRGVGDRALEMQKERLARIYAQDG